MNYTIEPITCHWLNVTIKKHIVRIPFPLDHETSTEEDIINYFLD